MEINKDRMEQAILYLASTDEDYARAKALTEGLGQQRKAIKASVFNRHGASSAAAREQAAYDSMEYRMHLEKMEMANVEYLTLQAKRSTECVVIDCWRSLNAARNRGQIV